MGLSLVRMLCRLRSRFVNVRMVVLAVLCGGVPYVVVLSHYICRRGVGDYCGSFAFDRKTYATTSPFVCGACCYQWGLLHQIRGSSLSDISYICHRVPYGENLVFVVPSLFVV